MSVARLVPVLLGLAVLVRPHAGATRRRRRSMLGPPGGGRSLVRALRAPGGGGWAGGRGWPGWRGGGFSPSRGAAFDREVLGLIEGLAAVMRAGLTPARAMRHLATGTLGYGDAPHVPGDDGRRAGDGRPAGDGRRVGDVAVPRLVAMLADQAESGARLEPVWRSAAQRLDSSALLAVAEGWGLAERHGAPVVEVLDAMVAALRDDGRVSAAIEASLAAPRASAALLGVLPLGGVVLGELVGVHPVSVLVGTPAGRVALGAGLTATLVGRWWMARLVRGVEAA